MTSDVHEGNDAPLPVGRTGNRGEPLRFAQVDDHIGFAAETAGKGQQVKIFTRLAITSDEPGFHRIAESVAGMIRACGDNSLAAIDIGSFKVVLLILKPDQTAELWLDTAAVAMQCVVTRNVIEGAAVFQHEIADMLTMEFPCVEFGRQDKVICLMREGWGFGLAFDMNLSGELDMDAFSRELARLYRQLSFRHLYEAVGNPESLDRLMAQGWFPFTEILHREFTDILAHHAGGLALDEIESSIVTQFDQARLDHMLSRWMAKPHFAAKEALLKEGVEAFLQGRPIAAIKVLVTEIEGILNVAYRTHTGKAGKTKALLAFAIESAEKRTGGPGTLFLTTEFNRYLLNYMFASYDPDNLTEGTVSRHLVGHGDAGSESYTLVKALQVILTLDQLAFYT
ncbi:hypothetical protein ACDH60_24745 [Pseudomonas ficuserectae]|uniref:Uncharacterized protein n=1 Tax=Pseudomonas amygdali pv. lachrymans TaxID=53707 RepID=A0AB37RBE9_PSEAV|nr:hypothetical protein [Pseudomonas amygdali]KKY56831.1 hypothetical protein AAY85_17490 [Pseudomonas amygdali pv. lachrymans]KPB99784.1 Uncharacterized protein AC501_5636 [Pseudomonas amygdali pv. lachrymans]RMM33133.1 hypothetical protein ALQ79_102863 [Pseudomonas amygdali pv. lachrymans]RMP33447.1 hypothetical protein ALQ26_03449 [Pseudomonas amygdali pv. lachrymans]RMU21323.1 hypothetical protein ALP33_102851 [Pseudomonas amygdali pv. lachrymans]